ncbi:hypothetical protein [Methylosinus sp. LW3]|uniref:hypothetical protein n=1 Tax=Methylosinus sp. LW3 TaxID=107635 RepID=UPI000466C3A3|nr:hypothetical protein [Methylosinus sp. LW3]
MLWKILGLVSVAFVAGGVIGATPRIRDEDQVSRAFFCGFTLRGMELGAPLPGPLEARTREAYERECGRFRQVALERVPAILGK